MKDKLSNFSKGTALLLMSATSLFGAYGDNGDDSRHERNDSCCPQSCGCCQKCCPPKDPCANCAQLWPTGGPDWIITPNAGPCVANSCQMFITAEFIYWAIREDNLGFAFTNVPSSVATGLTTPTTKRGSVEHPDWNMRPGFKVGIGWMSDCDGWDLYLNYTWLRTRSTRESVSTPSDDRIINDMNWTTQSTGQNSLSTSRFGSISRMTGAWEHDLNVLDLELGRNFFISECLHLRPHFGFKGSWRKQSMDVTATGTSDSSSSPVDVAANSRNRIDNWGFGVRAGLDTAWHFTRCFSLVGEAAVAAQWGKI